MLEREFKIIFSGPMGSGKTTAIRNVSDTMTVSTEVVNSEKERHSKDSTTVAMDFGQIFLPEACVNVYGTPGQERFSFMWEILSEHAMGVIILLDGSRQDSRDELLFFLQSYEKINQELPLIIGLGYHGENEAHSVDELNSLCMQHDIIAPIFTVDVREKDDVLLLINTLLSIIEARH